MGAPVLLWLESLEEVDTKYNQASAPKVRVYRFSSFLESERRAASLAYILEPRAHEVKVYLLNRRFGGLVCYAAVELACIHHHAQIARLPAAAALIELVQKCPGLRYPPYKKRRQCLGLQSR